MDDKIKEVMDLIDCFGGMKQNSGIECANKEDSDFYESIASVHRADIETKLRELVPAWLPIDAAPVNRTVLLGFRNENGNWRSTRGAWMDEVEIASWENDDYPVGWYETPVEGEECFYIEPTHWMPLPKEPS